MSTRALWLLLISGLTGTTGIVPATARTMAARVIARPTPDPGPVRFHHLAQRQIGLPIAISPYLPVINAMPAAAPPVEVDAAANPYVVIISGQPLAPTVPPAPSDHGYPAGCHAILYGYHCDIAHDPVAH